MDKISDVELLKTLLDIPSPSGFEQNIANFIYGYLSQFVSSDMIEVDNQNNVIVSFNNNKAKTIIVDAHLDEIGFMINNVDKYGSISLQYIGGGDSTILSARHLNILTSNGIVNAVVDRLHAHLVSDEDDENIYSPEQADVDVGLRDRESILKMIQIGDPVVYQSQMIALTKNYYSGYGFDDKAGCFLLIKTIEELVKKQNQLDMNVVFVFSAQEETGNSKLIPVVRRIKPNLVIEADVTFASDYGHEDTLETEIGRCKLDNGISLYRGTDIDYRCWDLVTNIARRKKIPFQVQACSGRIGYTSLEVTGENYGIKALVWGIPLRSMHTPVEIINLNDLLTGAKLLKYVLCSKKLSNLI